MSDLTIHSSNLHNLVIGQLGAKWSARGDRILRYYIDLRHTKLNLHKEVSAPELFILQSKVDALIAAWDEKFAQFEMRQALQSGKDSAEELTGEAIRRQQAIGTILLHTLGVNDAVDWDALKDKKPYQMPRSFPESAPLSKPQPEPAFTEPTVGFFDWLLGRKARLIAAAEGAYATALETWETTETLRNAAHARDVEAWKAREKAFWEEHEARKVVFLTEQAAANAKVDALQAELKAGASEAVVEHAMLVLENSDYDGIVEKSYTVQYHPDDKLLLLEYDLPAPDSLPQVKSVKFVKATGELVETRISDRERKANFESACYQICLRTIHELFEADVDGNLENILFNGVVDFVDPATGADVRSCILSIVASRPAFTAIDLARVDPKACFKSLKGVSAASLGTLAPIAPIMEMDREDRRFVDARAVGAEIDEATNLAAMPWEDFEHLVRELFEKEFLSRGGEVKVTQSSHDGGVDAIAFDPDPITGGKIVIQAKRYTRTVGVAAVRDLYGTVMNEGASKGILVTTADYGPDAYKFATGKPLTLLNGANLLHMLAHHGYRASINIKAARSMISA